MNQYHCETCKYMQVTDKGMSPDCEKTKHWLTEGDRRLTKEVGCASHSDFRGELERLTAMEMMLDNLNYFSHTVSEIDTEWFWKKLDVPKENRQSIINKRYELRQNDGE